MQFVTTRVGVTAILPLLFGTLRFAAVAVLLLPFAGVALALADPGQVASATAPLLIASGAAAQGLGTLLIKRLGPLLDPVRPLAWPAWR